MTRKPMSNIGPVLYILLSVILSGRYIFMDIFLFTNPVSLVCQDVSVLTFSDRKIMTTFIEIMTFFCFFKNDLRTYGILIIALVG